MLLCGPIKNINYPPDLLPRNTDSREGQDSGENRQGRADNRPCVQSDIIIRPIPRPSESSELDAVVTCHGKISPGPFIYIYICVCVCVCLQDCETSHFAHWENAALCCSYFAGMHVVRIYIWLYVYMCMYMLHMYIHTYMCVWLCIYIYMIIYIYVRCDNIYIYIIHLFIYLFMYVFMSYMILIN